MPNKIYEFLKANNLTSKDEASFEKEYSDPKKAEELHSFMSQNNLTTKNKDDFYNEYFVKKKEETASEGLSTPAPSPLQPSRKSGGLPSNIIEATETITKTPKVIGRGTGGKPIYEGEQIDKSYNVEEQLKNKQQSFLVKEGVNTPIPKELEQSIKASEKVAEQDRLAKIKENEAYDKEAEALPFAIKAKTVGSSIAKGAIEIIPTIMDVYANATGDPIDKTDVLKVRDFLDETFSEDERYKKTTINSIARNVATAGTMMATGGAGAAMQGAAIAGNESYNDAINNGASKSTATKAAVINMLGGAALESIPVFRALNRVGAKTGSNVYKNIWDASKNTIKGGAEEAVTGGLQQTLSNATANVLYDSTRDISDNVFNSSMDEGSAGLVINGLLNALNIKRGKTTIKSELEKIDKAIDYATATKDAIATKFKEKSKLPEQSVPENLQQKLANANPRQEVTQVPAKEATIPRTSEPVVPEGNGDTGDNGREIVSESEFAKTEAVTPKEGDIAKVPTTVAGVTSERKMVFNEGQWKQDVGGELTKVGLPLQEMAQSKFDESNKSTPIANDSVNLLISSGADKNTIDAITQEANTIASEIIKSDIYGKPVTPVVAEEGQDNGSRIPTSSEGSAAIPKGDEGTKTSLGEAKNVIADIVSKYETAQELQGAEKTQAMRAYKEAVNSNAKIKRIFENLNAINEALGVEKSSTKCP